MSSWSIISHRSAWGFSMKFPEGLREDAYQEFALAFLESRAKGKDAKYANYQAKLLARIPMREMQQLMRIPEGTWNKGLKNKPEELPQYTYLDQALPGEQTAHDLIPHITLPSMRGLPWEVLNKICLKVELKFIHALEDGQGDRQACIDAGYAITGAAMLRKRIAKYYREFMSTGKIRKGVILEKQREQGNAVG